MKGKNLLERVPKRNEKISWKELDGKVTLIIFRNSLFEKVMHKIFKKAKVVKLDLEDIGSYVWTLCDGSNNIYEISEKVEKKYGEKAKPTIERLIQYLNMLKNNGYIKVY